ncbi:FlaA1/EpsC-like NDP-sugar epimerase [Variovorax beijingensis]|uniref:FlaA1/EpsC-like NDP-sugar epimerase n=1 Tax=Variovorax beijingensis TaxID=2496117 RepID=A0A561C5H9_9BURK|nr:nucleoside-diphosphate sugar epimerase/dehydratase [Variovorax beijingensis]TWD86102.1 FlaA1/EpsC-like NDP-sugar epimerase [Variovorax beijingensis]
MIDRLAQPMLALPRPMKRLLALAVDAGLCVLCVWLALSLRYEQWVELRGAHWLAVGAAIMLALPLFVVTGLYRAIFRYAGSAALMAIMRACFVFSVGYVLMFTVVGVDGVPRTVGLLVPALLLLTVGASRLFARYWLGGLYTQVLRGKTLPQVVIYGAGKAGRQLAAALSHSPEMVVRLFVDDSPHLQGRTLNGLPIYPPSWLKANAAAQGITDVLLALPSVSQGRRAQILNELLSLHLHVRTLPGMADLAQGRVQVKDLMEVDIEDLLGRDPVAPDEDLLHRHVRGKVVLVTGAGGSIGSELCRQIAQLKPSVLLLVEWSEYALYAIHRELEQKAPALSVVPLLASVCDAARMRQIMGVWRPSTVYHAAAYKHVPLVEHNPVEGLINNALGTLTAALAARDHGVGQFVLVSTDKAVRPTNIMGASKRLAEMTLQGLAQQKPSTCFSMVRFGNVLGSSGSVVPLFRQQIEAGGPITLTHEDITRYFMTIPEAAQLVIQAGAMAEGGDVFVLEMGEPVRIIDLARRLVELSGRTVCDARNPEGDIELLITGLRPGEKLYEELLIGDNAMPTAHPRVMKAHEACPPWAELAQQIDELGALLERNDVPAIKCKLQELLGGYLPHAEVVDWVYMELERQNEALPALVSATPDGTAPAAAVPPQVLAPV